MVIHADLKTTDFYLFAVGAGEAKNCYDRQGKEKQKLDIYLDIYYM